MVKMRDVWDLGPEDGKFKEPARMSMPAIDATEAMRNDPKRYSMVKPKESGKKNVDASGAENASVTNADDSGQRSIRRGSGDATVEDVNNPEATGFGVREAAAPDAGELAKERQDNADAEEGKREEAAKVAERERQKADADRMNMGRVGPTMVRDTSSNRTAPAKPTSRKK